jgi:LPXTG-motif cell wall-anchored protein
MRRWIIFGLVLMLTFVAAANLAGPSAWASDAHAPYMTVPTRTPKPPNTPVPPTAPPTKPPKEPTDTPAPAPTNTPVIVQPTNTAAAVQLTKTATPRITKTATVPAETVEPTITPSVTATAISPAETTPTATFESTSTAVALPPASDDGAGAAPVVQVAPADNSSNLWLLIIAVALVLFGGVLLFGRRRTQDSTK